MKHLSSFIRMTFLIYSILNLGCCISSPLWLHSTSVTVHVPYDYTWKLLSFLFSFIYLSIHFLPSRRGEEMKTTEKMNKNLRLTAVYIFSRYFGSGTDEPVLRS